MITVLTGQHNAVNLLFGQLEKLRGSTRDEAEVLAQQVVIALMKHAISEQVHLYPAAPAAPG